MNHLLSLIYAKLVAVHPRVYQRKVPTNVTPVFPYVVFRFPSSSLIDKREDFVFEVDIWDNKPNDTSTLETLTANISKALDYKLFSNSNVSTNVYKINQLQIDDPDETIMRNQLRFQAKTYLT
jgi:hypothetical protein